MLPTPLQAGGYSRPIGRRNTMVDEHDKTLKALEAAIQMEIDGKEFYQKASRASNNELGTQLLAKLADEEDDHRQIFESIYKDISAEKGWPDWQLHADGILGLKTLFSSAVEEIGTSVKSIPEEIDAVQTAMDMENKTYDFYNEQLATANYDAEKKFYWQLAAQEKEHHRVLLDYYEFLKDPAAWFVLKEHPTIDGG
jgi:rubrerythrin